MDNVLANAAGKLYTFIYDTFWDGHGLIGPDAGLMFNLRVLRFVKSAFPSLRRTGRSYFLQTQGYWIKDNWDLYRVTGKSSYKEVAIACSNHVINKQNADGSWQYPLRDWKKYVSTVEGTWASLGLLESFQQTRNPIYLDAALKWYKFLISKISFQKYAGSIVVNYFAFSPKSRKVPNNTTLVLWFLLELCEATGDRKFLEFNDKMIRFLELCQKPNGELIYEIGTEHYLCYHYNSFEFLDLFQCYCLTDSGRIREILRKLASFIASGITEKGSVKYACSQTFPEVVMFSSVAGAALASASTIGFKDYEKHIKRLYRYVVENQRPDGSFFYSKHDLFYVRKPIQWGFLSDKNLYPGPMSFILRHLLIRLKSQFEKFSLE